MARWNDTAKWQSLIDGSGCPICARGFPLSVIATLPSSWLTMPEEAAMPGYLCMVSRIHAVELHDLSVAEAESFMRDARAVSKALSAVTSAVKINYEIHGNTLPHLHMHFYPRHRGDVFEGRAIDPKVVPQPVYGPGQLAEMRDRLLDALSV